MMGRHNNHENIPFGCLHKLLPVRNVTAPKFANPNVKKQSMVTKQDPDKKKQNNKLQTVPRLYNWQPKHSI